MLIKPEDILKKQKYQSLTNLVLICEAMEEYAAEINAVHPDGNDQDEGALNLLSHFDEK